jgi:hypothetical protein
MDPSSQIRGGVAVRAVGAAVLSGFAATRLRAGDSQRITSADEIWFSESGDSFDLDGCVRAGENYAAAESLSCCVAELRRGNRHAVTDFFGQQ